MTEKRGRKPYKNGGQGGGWQRLSSQLATVFEKAVDKHGGQDALADTIAAELSERPIEALRLVATLMPKNINLQAEITPSESLSLALSNVQQALEVQRSESAKKIDVIDGDFTESD